MRPSNKANGGRKNLALGAGVFLAAALPFLSSVSGAFLNWDDAELLVNNPAFRGFSFDKLWWMFTTMTGGHYMPLTWLSFAANHAVGGMDPFGYRLVNVLLHAANALLFFFAARRLYRAAGRPDSPGPAILAALFFGLHPQRVESVAWITERRDVLSAFFWLASLNFYLLHREKTGAAARRSLALCFGAFCLSLLAKAWAITFPAALLILDVFLKRHRRPGLWRERLPFWLMAGAFAWIAARAQLAEGAAQGFAPQLKQVAAAPLFYAQKVLWPAGLSPFYEFPPGFAASALWALAALAGAGLTAAAFWGRRRYPALAAAWLFFVLTILPVSGIFQSGRQFAADRYTYIAALPWALFFGLLWSRRASRAAAAAGLAALAVLSHRYAIDWRQSETLWRRAAFQRPDSGELRAHWAGALFLQGRHQEAAAAYEEALRLAPDNGAVALYAGEFYISESHPRGPDLLARAAQLSPLDAAPHERMGQYLAQAGRTAEAAAAYRAALERRPRYWQAHCGLGAALWKQGDREGALAAWRQAESLFPESPDVQHNLAIAALAEGRPAEAEARESRALALKPAFPEALANRASARWALGLKNEARADLMEAARLRPGWDAAAEALKRLDAAP